MLSYEHHAQYYETDQMGIIHHSNYIRWMEEARVYFLERIGWGYKQMENGGLIIPVTAVSCEYKSMVHFDDVVCVALKVTEYQGVRLTFSYRITDKATGELRAVGESKHCFCNREGRPIRLKKLSPGFDETLQKLLQEESPSLV